MLYVACYFLLCVSVTIWTEFFCYFLLLRTRVRVLSPGTVVGLSDGQVLAVVASLSDTCHMSQLELSSINFSKNLGCSRAEFKLIHDNSVISSPSKHCHCMLLTPCLPAPFLHFLFGYFFIVIYHSVSHVPLKIFRSAPANFFFFFLQRGLLCFHSTWLWFSHFFCIAWGCGITKEEEAVLWRNVLNPLRFVVNSASQFTNEDMSHDSFTASQLTTLQYRPGKWWLVVSQIYIQYTLHLKQDRWGCLEEHGPLHFWNPDFNWNKLNFQFNKSAKMSEYF